MRPEKWLELAGLAMWVVSGLPTFLAIASGRLSRVAAAAWLAAFLIFGLAFGLACFKRWTTRGPKTIALVLQTVAALAMIPLGGDAMPASLLVVVAGQLLWGLPLRAAVVWVVVQSVALFVIALSYGGADDAVLMTGAYAGFQVFALATASLALSERRAREALAVSNAELHATRALLSEASRVSERLRISRDLHDTLGHHLTALSLQLDVASRLTDGKAAEHLHEAHAITRLLLGDVRDVVSDLRETSRVELTDAIRALVTAPSGLAIHLDMPAALDVQDPDRAQALLRCVQEIITNAARHAGAKNLWIRLERRDGGIALDARDDGHGTARLTPGHGLTGMRERFAALAGSIDFESKPHEGFQVRGFLPART